jgi:glycosyltransferase involved in cell wall biosynthesis
MTLETPRVTVAIPTYNRAAMLGETVRSVLAQDDVPLEVFVVDNASTDETAVTIAAIGDPRLHLVRQPFNKGPLANMNDCLRVGTAPYVTVLHDDDTLRAGSLARRARELDADGRLAAAYSYYGVIDQFGNTISDCYRWKVPTDPVEDGSTFIRHSLHGEVRCHSSLALLRRSMLEGLDFADADGSFADLGLWLRLVTRGPFRFVPEPLGDVRVHDAAQGAAMGNFEMRGDVVVRFAVEQTVKMMGIFRRVLADRSLTISHRVRLRLTAEWSTLPRATAAACQDLGVSDRNPVRIMAMSVRSQPLVALHPRVLAHFAVALLPHRVRGRLDTVRARLRRR